MTDNDSSADSAPSGPVLTPTGGKPPKVYTRPRFVRRWGTRVLALIGAFSLIVGVIAIGFLIFKAQEAESNISANQTVLDPFYQAPDTIPSKPGTLIRSEPMTFKLANGDAYRILYVSQDRDNKPVVVGGMVFIPKKAVPAGGSRKVVAWAHPTVGLAQQCAPSRANKPELDTPGWLPEMMNQGWVVTATDYYGLGTAGPKTYLLGQQEAKDVVNSVRAARNLKDAQAGSEWVVWGHSQGGHSSLWTGALAGKIAPELKLLGVGAAAPAQQLLTIIQKQWPNKVGWTIGGEAIVSFQDYYTQFDLMNTLSTPARNNLTAINEKCVIPAALTGALLAIVKGPFFNSDPLQNPQWVMLAEQQTPPMPPKGMPVFLSEGTSDEVVIAGTNANLQEQWCKAGVDLSVVWLGNVGHMAVANSSGPLFVEWTANLFEGKTNQVNCKFPPASTPIPEPIIPTDIRQQADALLKQYPLPPITP